MIRWIRSWWSARAERRQRRVAAKRQQAEALLAVVDENEARLDVLRTRVGVRGRQEEYHGDAGPH